MIYLTRIFQLLLIQATVFVAAVFFSQNGSAQSAPANLNVSGTLYDSSGNLINNASVDFRLELMDESENCVLYSERHVGQDLSASKGGFSLQLGSGTSPDNKLQSSATFTTGLFANNGATGAFPDCAGGVTLSAGSARVIRVSYDLGSGMTALAPAVPIVSSAYALVADSVQGMGPTNFVQIRDDATYDLNQANVENVFSAVNYPILQALLTGSSSQYITANPSSSVFFNDQRLTNVATPTLATDAANRGYVDSVIGGRTTDLSGVSSVAGDGRTLVWDQAGNRWVTGVPTAVDASKLPLTGGTMSGNINMNGYQITNLAAGSISTNAIANNAITSAKINNTGTGINRLLITDAVDGTTISYSTCDLNDVLRWTATGWACSSVATISPVTSVAGKSGAVTLNMGDISGYGTSALVNTGTAANEIVQLDALARIPALDGSLITNLNAIRIQNRSVASTAPSGGQFLGWNATSAEWEPITVSTSAVTSLTGDVVGTGPGATATTIVNNAITSNKINATGVGANQLLITDATAGATVTYKTCSNGDILKWSTGTGWDCAAGSGTSGLFADGAATAPSVSFTNDPDTGMYRLGANQLAIATQGTGRFFVNSNGFVGVGTTSPSQALSVIGNLSIGEGATSTPHIVFQNLGWGVQNRVGMSYSGDIIHLTSNGSPLSSGTTANLSDTGRGTFILSAAPTFFSIQNAGSGANPVTLSNRFFIGNFGNIGVGTTTPQAILDLSSTNTLSALIVPRATTANRPQAGFQVNGMIRYNTDNNKFEAYEAGSWVNMIGAAGTGATLFADGAATAPSISFANDTDTGIYRSTANQIAFATQGTARMYVGASGNLGLGVIPSIYRLDVQASSDQASLSATNTRTILSNFDGGSGGDAYFDINALPQTTADDSYIRLFRNTTAAAAAVLIMRGDSTTNANHRLSAQGTSYFSAYGGNVGIGTSTPLAALDVTASNTTSALIVPRADTANRPQAGFQVNGMIRYNTDLNKFEAYENGAWANMIGSTSTSAASLFADGSATAPSISFASDTDTGIYRAGANQLSITTSGVSRVTVDSVGNVGVGTTAPEGGVHIVREGYSTLNTDTFSSADPYVSGGVTMRRARGSIATPEYLLSGDRMGFFDATSALNPGGYTGMHVYSTEDQSATAQGAEIRFFTVPNGSLSVVRRLTITSNGNIGIGEASPRGILELGATGTNSALIVPRATTANRPQAGFQVNGMIRYNTTLNKFEAYENGAWTNMIGASTTAATLFADGAATAPSVSFANDTDTGVYRASANQLELATGGTARMAINNQGFVGIGTSSPLALLHVASSTGANNLDIGNANTFSKRIIFRHRNATDTADVTSSVGVGTTMNLEFNKYAGDASNLSTGVFGNAGGLNSINPFWQGYQFAAGTLTEGGTTRFPRASLFYSYTNAADPTDLYFTIALGNSGTLRQSLRLQGGTGSAGGDVLLMPAGNVGVGTTAPLSILDVASTTTMSALIVPRATTANRPQAGFQVNGMIRYNTTTNKFEAYENGAWANMIGSTSTSAASLFADGAATAPSISFASDSDTGIYRASANQLEIATGGTARMAVDSTGNVGLGTTSPTAALDLAAGDVSMIIGADNLVKTRTNATQKNARIAIPHYLSAEEPIALWMAQANNGTAELNIGGSSSLMNSMTNIRFFTSNVNTTLSGSERMSIDRFGSVGIGAPAPQAILDVASTNTMSALIVPRATTANRPQAGFQVNGMIRYNTTTNKFEAYENGAWANMIGTVGTSSATLFADGTESAPAVSFANDTDTGMYLAGTNQIGLTTQGTSRLTVSSAGIVNISATTLASSASNGALVVAGGLGVNGNIFAGGSVNGGLIRANGTNSLVYATSATTAPTPVTGNSYAQATNNSNNDGTAAHLLLTSNNSSSNTQRAYLSVVSSSGAGSYTPAIVIGQQNGANSYTERLRIDQVGNLGLGTVTPMAILDIASSDTMSALIVPRATTANRPQAGFQVNGMIRYNTTTNKFEAYENGAWANMIGSSGVTDIDGLSDGKTTGATNVLFLGTSAGAVNTGSANVAVGHLAFTQNLSGADNTAIGISSMANKGGNSNTAIQQ